jgi:hypothetical protein
MRRIADDDRPARDPESMAQKWERLFGQPGRRWVEGWVRDHATDQTRQHGRQALALCRFLERVRPSRRERMILFERMAERYPARTLMPPCPPPPWLERAWRELIEQAPKALARGFTLEYVQARWVREHRGRTWEEAAAEERQAAGL